jgi:hypothetical protein
VAKDSCIARCFGHDDLPRTGEHAMSPFIPCLVSEVAAAALQLVLGDLAPEAF